MSKKIASHRAELERLAMAAFLDHQRAAKIADDKRTEARRLKRKARRLRALAGIIDLPEPGPNGTVGFRRTQPKIRHPEFPFYVALAKKGLSVPDFARLQVDPPLHKETARHWMKIGGRPCPESWARRIHKQYPSVPVTDDAWPNGIRWGS